MPEFEKLSRDEVNKILMAKEKGHGLSQRELILRSYMERLQGLEVGEGLEIKLDKSDNRQTVKNRLLRAADRLGIEIEFIRSRHVIRLHRIK